MSNSNRTNIAAASFSWRDRPDEIKITSKIERIAANVNKSISSIERIEVNVDGKVKGSEDGVKVESTCEEITILIEDHSCLTPTKDKISSSDAWFDVSPPHSYSVKPELCDTIVTYCIELNERAKKLYLAGQYDAALKALHDAEWQRQKLVDLVKSEMYAQMYCQIVHHSVSDCQPVLSLRLDHISLDRVDTQKDAVEVKRNYIYQRSEFDEGIRLFEGIESIPSFSVADTQSDFLQVCHIVEATITFNIGQVIRRQGDLERASRFYEDALGILKYNISTSTGHEVLIPIYHNLGYILYHSGDLQKTKKIYSQAYHHAKELYGPRHIYVVWALNCLGVVHYHSTSVEPKRDDENTKENGSSFIKAMECFKEALSILDSLSTSQDADRATIINNCGRIHVQNDEYDEALCYYEVALRIRRDCLGPNNLDYAATAFNAGQCWHQKRELDRAYELYQEFLRVALMKFGHGHRDVAVVLSGMAQIHQEKHQYDQALELYEQSLSSGLDALGDNHTEIATLLNKMGNFYVECDRFEDALNCYRRGLAIEKKQLPDGHPNLLVSLSNLGEIYRKCQRWKDAADSFLECLEILRRNHGNEDNTDTGDILQKLGLVEDQRGDSLLALDYLQKSLSMKRRLVGGNQNVDISETLVYIATILTRKRECQAAMGLLTEALHIRESALGRYHGDVALVLYNIGLIHQQCGRYEAAIESYAHTLCIEKEVLGERCLDVAMTLLKLGESQKAAGNLDYALRNFEESVSILRGLFDTGIERGRLSSQDFVALLARTLNEIGNIHHALGDTASMMEVLNEASRLYRRAGLNSNNVAVDGGQLHILDFRFPEGAPAA